MPIVIDSYLEEARSQIVACRADIIQAVRRLQAMSNPPAGEVPNMCTAVLELFTTQIQFEVELARTSQADGSAKLQNMRDSVRALRESVAAMDRCRAGTR